MRDIPHTTGNDQQRMANSVATVFVVGGNEGKHQTLKPAMHLCRGRS